MDGPLHDRTFACDRVDARRVDGDWDHIDIDLGCEPSVEAHLRIACLAPFLEGSEVEKAEVDRRLTLSTSVSPMKTQEMCVSISSKPAASKSAFSFPITFGAARQLPYQPRGRRPRVGELPVTQFWRVGLDLRTVCAIFSDMPLNLGPDQARGLLPVGPYDWRRR